MYDDIAENPANLCIQPHGESGGTITLNDERWEYASTEEGTRPQTPGRARVQYTDYRASGGRLVLSVDYDEECYDERGELTDAIHCYMGFAIDPDGEARFFTLYSSCADCDNQDSY